MLISIQNVRVGLRNLPSLISAVLLSTTLGFAQITPVTYTEGQPVKLEGYITSRDDNRIWVRDAKGTTSIVEVTEYTKIQSAKGMLKLRSKSHPTSALLPGLKVKVNGRGSSNGTVMASKVHFNNGDLTTARSIQAANAAKAKNMTLEQASYTTTTPAEPAKPAEPTTPAAPPAPAATAGTTATSSIDRGLLTVKDTATVNFDTGKFMLSDDAKRSLDDVISKAKGVDGVYLLEIKGYTDNTGQANRNLILSKRRADAVVSYLTESGQIPVQRILTPVGMGETQPVANNDTVDGRANNRRVDVNVLVRKDQNQQNQ